MRSHEERFAETKRRIAARQRREQRRRSTITTISAAAACLVLIVGVSFAMPGMVAGIRIEIDGGVNRKTGEKLVKAGADVLVAGSAIFGAEDPEEEIKALKALSR